MLSFQSVTLKHVPREQNKQADALCNKVIKKYLKTKIN